MPTIDEKRKAFTAIKSVSIEKLASLSGEVDYQYLEKLRSTFSQFIESQIDIDKSDYCSFSEAWKAFIEKYSLVTLERKV